MNNSFLFLLRYAIAEDATNFACINCTAFIVVEKIEGNSHVSLAQHIFFFESDFAPFIKANFTISIGVSVLEKLEGALFCLFLIDIVVNFKVSVHELFL